MEGKELGTDVSTLRCHQTFFFQWTKNMTSWIYHFLDIVDIFVDRIVDKKKAANTRLNNYLSTVNNQ